MINSEIDWSKVNASSLQQIEKSYSDNKFHYQVTYQGRSVSIESANEMDMAKIQQLALKKMKQQETKVSLLIKMPKPVRDISLQKLDNNDLEALDSALSKIKTDDIATLNLKQQVKEQILKGILEEHPTWKSVVNSWQAPIEDKIWLLQLYQLRALGVKIRALDFFLPKKGIAPTKEATSLLKSETREAINATLAQVTKLDAGSSKLQKVPQGIYLLVNLEDLNLFSNKLTEPPNVRHFPNLKILNLGANQLTKAPDVSKNLKLQDYNLSANPLKAPPDVRQNAQLKVLSLTLSGIQTPPDVSQNVNLEELNLEVNQLQQPPDVSHNRKLRKLYLGGNRLTTLPDLKSNGALERLRINEKHFTEQESAKLKQFTADHPKCHVENYA